MTTRIYLIRHAEAEGNLYRIAQGQYDSILTDWGRRQVMALAERFRDISIDAVYASDLYRTCATARAVYVPKGLSLHKCSALREICVGDWEQKPWGRIARETPEELRHFNDRLDLWRIPGAETCFQLRDRMRRAVRDIAAAHPGETAAVFSHGCAIRVLLADLEGRPMSQLGETPVGDNTAVSLLEADGDQLRIVFRDDNSHLDGLSKKGPHLHALEPGLYYCPATEEDRAFLDACRTDCTLAALDDAARPVSIAWQRQQPVGVLQLEPDRDAADGKGWISVYWMAPAFRNRGLGVQLLGQAVQFYRPRERHTLCLSLPADSSDAARFFRMYGFAPAGAPSDSGQVYEKDISYRMDWTVTAQ